MDGGVYDVPMHRLLSQKFIVAGMVVFTYASAKFESKAKMRIIVIILLILLSQLTCIIKLMVYRMIIMLLSSRL